VKALPGWLCRVMKPSIDCAAIRMSCITGP